MTVTPGMVLAVVSALVEIYPEAEKALKAYRKSKRAEGGEPVEAYTVDGYRVDTFARELAEVEAAHSAVDKIIDDAQGATGK